MKLIEEYLKRRGLRPEEPPKEPVIISRPSLSDLVNLTGDRLNFVMRLRGINVIWTFPPPEINCNEVSWSEAEIKFRELYVNSSQEETSFRQLLDRTIIEVHRLFR